MCIKPQWQNGNKVACRYCAECIAVKKWDWVAKALAETATQKWAGVITLTYDESPQSFGGKIAFRYRDVQDWIRRLRRLAKLQAGRTVNLKYLVAGENGSKKGRVHWHVILWCDVNLFSLGEWADFWRSWDAGVWPSQGVDQRFLREHAHEVKLIWSEWPFGNVQTDAMNIGSAEYVLKYAMKDMFGAHKSKGQKRERNSEVYAAGFFRMSTGDPIGWEFVWRWLREVRDRRQVVPELKIQVPGMLGYWVPRGVIRERIEFFLAFWKSSLDREGVRLAGWEALVANLSRTEYGQATLAKIEGYQHGQEIEIETQFGDHSPEHNVCGRVFPCARCQAGSTDAEFDQIVLWAIALRRRWLKESRPLRSGGRSPGFDAWQLAKGERNPFCKTDGKPPRGVEPVKAG